MALGIVLGDPDSTAKFFVGLKTKLDKEKEKAARITAQIEIDVLTQAAKDLKISTDRLLLEFPLSKTRSNT
jgi:hypothetical protein